MALPRTSRAQAALKQASAAFQRQQWPAAARAFREVLGADPAYAEAYPLLAAALERSGALQEAVEVLVTATEHFPKDGGLFLRLGNLLAGVGHWQDAASCFQRASELSPGDARAAFNWGVALQELGQPVDAIPAFERALNADAQYTAAYLALAQSYQATGVPEAALMALDCARQSAPTQARPAVERVRLLLSLGRLPQVLADTQELLTRFPKDVELYNLRGIALKQSGQSEEALHTFTQALALQPDAVEPLHNRANLELLQRHFSTALADFDHLQTLRPDLDWLRGLHLYTAMHLYDWQDFDDRLAALLDGLAKQHKVVQPLILQNLVDDPAAHQQAARLWMQSSVTAPSEPLPITVHAAGHAAAPMVMSARHAGTGATKLRVAYISRDFRMHPVAFLMAEVLELHDRQRFEVLAVNYGPARPDDPMQQRIRAGVDGFLDVAHHTDREIAQACRELRVDVAVDLTGFTEGARSGIFAERPAPVQVLYLGYLGTSGTAHYDYLVSDPVLVSPETRAFYDEHLMVLPSYQANDRQRPHPALHTSRSELGLPDDAFVLCCFNNPSKITPAMFQLWVDVLRQVPGSVLWLLEEDPAAAVNLRRHADASGVGAHRLVFASRAPRELYLERLQQADLFLDTLPYNAGTTASDALWMGLPVVTLQGRSFCGRMAASLLTAAGLPQLIARDAKTYVDTAVRLALTPSELAALRQQLHDRRMSMPLFDSPRFIRHLERAYGEAHRLRSAGEPLRDIHITASP
ncbi:O-linked N-acetylglucosamine transferase, SPINDLY family protein [Roseateles terrae]|uniref:protein O-GlcNAc transferase n=1 Tax=Roseateles terrae TaxID=431060 RepID=A0ABR6GUC1_9BURK|nr:tetratricopeptide repeat protein [Roseateles terrae]MBB3194743.1 putative O-linked N-acetylglucosamine transferase (SPINDLY family) [Roseateles terrae]